MVGLDTNILHYFPTVESRFQILLFKMEWGITYVTPTHSSLDTPIWRTGKCYSGVNLSTWRWKIIYGWLFSSHIFQWRLFRAKDILSSVAQNLLPRSGKYFRSCLIFNFLRSKFNFQWKAALVLVSSPVWKQSWFLFCPTEIKVPWI